MESRDKYYCPEDCVHGHFFSTGNGQTEPIQIDFTCNKEDACVDDNIINFSADQKDARCPFYQSYEEVGKQ